MKEKAARACKKLGNFKWLKFYAWRDKINNLILNAKLNFSNIPAQTTKSFLKPALLLTHSHHHQQHLSLTMIARPGYEFHANVISCYFVVK
jgi:hypothetical protein